MPKSPYVRLIRRVQHLSPHGGINVEGKRHSDVVTTLTEPSSFSPLVPPAGDSIGKAGYLNTVENEIGVAVWWVRR